MAKKITVTGKTARRIEDSGRTQRRIAPEDFASALGAEQIDGEHVPGMDPIALAALGSELIKRLRSSGGRPALSDATEICRVPLSADDLKALESITDQIARSTGTKPSAGQLASVAVREFLRVATTEHKPSTLPAPGMGNWPTGWNGNREKYRAAQELIQNAKTTWGTKDAA